MIKTRDDPERNSRMMTSRVFWSMSPCVAETVWSRSRILSVSQSTCERLNVDFGVKNDVSFFPSLSVVVVLSVVVLLLLLPLVVPLSLLFLSLLSLSFSHLAARVGENDRLGDRERLVEVAEGVKLPLLALLLFWFFFQFFFSFVSRTFFFFSDASLVPHKKPRNRKRKTLSLSFLTSTLT